MGGRGLAYANLEIQVSASETARAETQNNVVAIRFFQSRYAATTIMNGTMMMELPMNDSTSAMLTKGSASASTAQLRI